jgi:glucose-1-phosphatase
MYTSLIFDLGKVIFDYSWEKTFSHWSAVSGIESTYLQKNFSFDEAFKKFERGDVTPEEFRTHVSTKLGFNFSEEDFETGWNGLYLESFPGIKEMLFSLRENYKVVALSNTNVLHAKKFPGMFEDELQHFGKIFLSHELRARKPEAESFLPVLNYLQENPRRVLFMDDIHSNIVGAENLGIKGIHVKSPQQMMADLKYHGITW